MRPALGLTWICVRPGSWYSTGSSIVMMFVSGVVDHVQRRVEAGGLAGAGRAGDEGRAVGAREAGSEAARACPPACRACRARCRACSLSRIRSTIFSPLTEGSEAMRRSIGWPPTVRPTRPSCGRRFSAMSRLAMILRREVTPGDHAARHRGRVVQHAVDAVADAHVLALGLEVDVGGALLDALGDHAVDELDDRRLAGGLADLGDLAEVVVLLLVLLDRLGDRGVELARVARSPRRCPRRRRPPAGRRARS